MLDHIAVQVSDVDAAAAFYLRVFGPLGVREAMRFERDGGLAVGLAGPDGQPRFWLGPAGGPADRELHVAFAAPSREAVDAVHAAALAAGAEVLHAPRVWPQRRCHSTARATTAFVRDLDGNNVEAVHHGAP